jgi:hypothetical protein
MKMQLLFSGAQGKCRRADNFHNCLFINNIETNSAISEEIRKEPQVNAFKDGKGGCLCNEYGDKSEISVA